LWGARVLPAREVPAKSTSARRSTALIEPDCFIELARTYIGQGGGRVIGAFPQAAGVPQAGGGKVLRSLRNFPAAFHMRSTGHSRNPYRCGHARTERGRGSRRAEPSDRGAGRRAATAATGRCERRGARGEPGA